MKRKFACVAMAVALAGCASIPGAPPTEARLSTSSATSSVPVSTTSAAVADPEIWEYDIETDNGDYPMTENRANALGASGWELVSIVHDTSTSGWYDRWTFKRRKKST